jgi:hypothetical protein
VSLIVLAADRRRCAKAEKLVEAAGVEPGISVENTQLTDSENASTAENATIYKSAVQTLYKL